jgi:SAM-dependent methyltransferase
MVAIRGVLAPEGRRDSKEFARRPISSKLWGIASGACEQSRFRRRCENFDRHSYKENRCMSPEALIQSAPCTRRAALLGVGAALLAASSTLATPAFAEPAPSLDVPYVPTPQEVVNRMLEIAKVTGKDFVMDLGCGDGRMLVTAASKYGSRGFGVDLNPVRIKEATDNAARAKVGDKVQFEVRNLFDTPIKDADVLTMYLLPSVNLQLRPRILEEMKPGSRIVSHAFNMGDWDPDLRENVDGRDVYFWIVPAKVEGKWTITDGGAKIALDLKQSFQMLEGSADSGASKGKAQGRIAGQEVRISVNLNGQAKIYAGRLSGGKLTPISGGGWSGSRG